MTIEFETLAGARITAPLSSVLYVRNDKKSHSVAIKGDELEQAINEVTYAMIREALRGFEEAGAGQETEEKP
jgi:hypothetical protein